MQPSTTRSVFKKRQKCHFLTFAHFSENCLLRGTPRQKWSKNTKKIRKSGFWHPLGGQTAGRGGANESIFAPPTEHNEVPRKMKVLLPPVGPSFGCLGGQFLAPEYQVFGFASLISWAFWIFENREKNHWKKIRAWRRAGPQNGRSVFEKGDPWQKNCPGLLLKKFSISTKKSAKVHFCAHLCSPPRCEIQILGVRKFTQVWFQKVSVFGRFFRDFWRGQSPFPFVFFSHKSD